MKIIEAHAYKVIKHVGHGVLGNKKITSTHNKTLIFYFFKWKEGATLLTGSCVRIDLHQLRKGQVIEEEVLVLS